MQPMIAHPKSPPLRRSPPPGLLLAALALLCAGAPAQGGEGREPAPAPLKSDTEALEAISRCVQVQTPKGTAPEIRSFQAELSVTLWEDDQGARVQRPRSGTILQYWTRDGDVIRYHRQLEITGAGTVTALMTDGRGAWLQSADEPARNLVTDPNLEKDLESLRKEIARTSELMRSFFVANLAGEDVVFQMADRGIELELPHERRTIPVDRILRIRRGEELMILSIGKEDGRLYEVELGPKPGGSSRESFHFEHHRILDDGEESQLLVPCVVQFRRDGQEILVARAEAPHKIQFNKRIARAVFRPRP